MESYSGELDHLLELRTVVLKHPPSGRTTTATLAGVEVLGRGVMARFEGITTPEEARQWSGWEIHVPRSACAPLSSGEVYVADLIGKRVRDPGGRVGTVVGMYDGPQAALLEVATEDGVRLVPLLDRFVGDLDGDAVEIREPWLLD